MVTPHLTVQVQGAASVGVGGKMIVECAMRGCHQPVAAPGGHALTKCVPCLLGTKKADKVQAQIRAVAALPPMLVPSDSWGFRIPGSPRSWNNAIVRPQHGRPYMAKWAKAWKEQIRVYATLSRPAKWNLGGRYVVEIRSWFATNASDVDGPVKMVLDALKGISWFDDKQVVHAPPWKEVDPVAPRLEVTISVVQVEGKECT